MLLVRIKHQLTSLIGLVTIQAPLDCAQADFHGTSSGRLSQERQSVSDGSKH
jgi:hypothetical protein